MWDVVCCNNGCDCDGNTQSPWGGVAKKFTVAVFESGIGARRKCNNES